jgi:alpha-D-ribose 1-methylphosphonate 5-triphosphate synthase subunit PhnH
MCRLLLFGRHCLSFLNLIASLPVKCVAHPRGVELMLDKDERVLCLHRAPFTEGLR